MAAASHRRVSARPRRRLWLVVDIVAVLVVVAVVAVILVSRGGHSTSYRIGFRAGEDLVRTPDKARPVGDTNTDLYTCASALDDLRRQHPGGAVVGGDEGQLNVLKIDSSDYVNGCYAGIRSAIGN